MIAFISDIHSNTEALGACLAEIDRLGCKRIQCLGDVIGYGPEPRETLFTVIDRCEFSLLGNHEHGAMFYASDFNPKARAAIEWTRDQLQRRDRPRDENRKLWDYLGDMKTTHRENGTLLAHGSPRDPVKEYLVPRDAADLDKMNGCFAEMGDARVCFVGHSHVPGVYLPGGSFQSPTDVGDEFVLGAPKTIINIGSVGQPRDGDIRASFCTLDGDTVRFHRVAYDVEATMAKIRAVPELPDFLADRLAVGK